VATTSRRRFVASAAALSGGASLSSACSQGADVEGYEAVATRIWRASESGGIEGSALRQELVRCATLAPSSHKPQCWKFALEAQAITIFPDLSQRCPAVGPDDHHVFVSLGCAAENLAQAALAHGLQVEARFDAGEATHMALTPTAARRSPLFNAITSRQRTRGDYDGQPLSREELALLETAGTSNDVCMLLLTERPTMEATSTSAGQVWHSDL